jgi:2',3'-cyclic-nucleotide 2'-phosphodiesterase/3'-nucleotidase
MIASDFNNAKPKKIARSFAKMRPENSWSRREFLRIAGSTGLFSAIPNLARAAERFSNDVVTISILHTTDLHGHILPAEDYSGRQHLGGMARCVTQVRKWRDENPNSILIDVGDVYQGTDVGLRSKGELMIDLFNLTKYDAWIVGNHEFDWGIEPFLNVLRRSTMPVLAANTLLEGKSAGEFADGAHAFAKIRPYLLKEIAGIKIAIIGITTPGMQFWFRPEFTKGIDFQFPVEPVRRAIAQAKEEGANAIILAGHMGLKERSGGDDFANAVMSLTSEFPEAAVFIAGHTHRNVPSRMTNGVLFTQANHFGIYVGRVDLVFDRATKKLLHQSARCELMDDRIPLDPTIISRSQSQLHASDRTLEQPIGELAETLRVRSRPGEPSEVEMLIGAAIAEALARDNAPIDGVLHGVFDEENNFRAGSKTVGDIWNVLPYENYVVTAELATDEIVAVMEEVFLSHEDRNLMGFQIRTEGRGPERRIKNIALENGQSLERAKRYRIAFNTFDSRSGGHHFMKLRDLLEKPQTRCTLHSLQTRDALIDYFVRHKTVHKVGAGLAATA